MRSSLVVGLVVAATLLVLPLRAHAQDLTVSATVSGTVTDSTGGVLPGVTVRGIHEATGGRGADLVLEATDSPLAFEHAARACRIGGRVVLVGIPEANQYTLTASEARRRGLSVKFSRRMPEVYPRAIALAASGRMQLAPLASHSFALDEAAKAFELQAARADGVIKAIIYP